MKHCGCLNIDKPAGMTSREVVNHVVRIARRAKVGHAGTLDPLATGVLVVCVGHATRLISLAQEGCKRYTARFVLGQTSDTDDCTGTIVEGGDYAGVTETELEGRLSEFTGRILQVPPQFSAVHVNGQRAYDLARRGMSVTLEARPVEVYSIRLARFALPEFVLEIECGSGTYVRSIGRDLGARLGCGAMMTELRRNAVGQFEVRNAVGLDALTADSLSQHLQPALQVVAHLPRRQLTESDLTAIRRGQSLSAGGIIGREPDPGAIRSDHSSSDRRLALIGPDQQLAGIGETDTGDRRIHPRIVFPD